MPAARADFALSPSAGRNNCQSWVFPPKGSGAVCFARWLPWRQVEVTRGKSQSYSEDGVREKVLDFRLNVKTSNEGRAHAAYLTPLGNKYPPIGKIVT